MLITINFVTSTDVSAVIHLILTGISVPFGLVFRRDRIVQTCDHSYVIIAIMLRITYCLSQMRRIQPGNRVSKRNTKRERERESRREFYFFYQFLIIQRYFSLSFQSQYSISYLTFTCSVYVQMSEKSKFAKIMLRCKSSRLDIIEKGYRVNFVFICRCQKNQKQCYDVKAKFSIRYNWEGVKG